MSTLTDQSIRHIYLTNGCCEPTDHVGRRRLTELGLGYGWVNGANVITANNDNGQMEVKPDGYDFYPLTKEEASLISEDGFYTGEGYVGHTGYTTLYKGKKWLTPTVEIEWFTQEKARNGYLPEEMHARTSDEALMIARQLAARVSDRLSRIGGYAEIEEVEELELDEVAARWTVAIHIPMEWAVENIASRCFDAYECYTAFLRGLTL